MHGNRRVEYKHSMLTNNTRDEDILGCRSGAIVDRLPNRLSHGILAWVEKTPDAPAIRCESVTWTYRQLADAVREAKNLLLENGVRPGDRIMVINENGRELIALTLAASELDVWIAVISSRLAPREIDLIRDDCDPRLILYTVTNSVEAKAHCNRHGARIHRGRMLRELGISDCFDSAAEPVHRSAVDQVLALIYTTGTTGRPKGVMLTHRNLLFVAMVSGRLRGIRPGEHVYAVLPMSHVFGLSAVACATLFCGGCAHLVARFDPDEAIRALREDGISGFLGVPTMYARMLEVLNSQKEKLAAPDLRFIYAGGAPLDADIKSRVESCFELPLHNGYGLTESSPTITQTRLYAPVKDCSVGQPLPGVEVRIIDPDGLEVKQGSIGELWARGPNIMKGYFRNAELSAEAISSDGWLKTGDLVFQDQAGNVNIVGRSKELIIHSGFNIYPPEVEGVLNSHPEVMASAVLGQPRDGNEDVIAFVQISRGSELNASELRAYAKTRLSPYKVPREIIFVQTLPTAPSGKILKARLRSLLDG